MLAFVLAACSSSDKTAGDKRPEALTNPAVERMKEANREQALKHFVDGALYDSKGDYAKAVL